MPDYIKKARKLERKKEFLRAAEYYVLGGEHEHAIELFVKQKLFLKAAKLAERIGKLDQAADYYGKIGDFNHAAEILKQAGDFFQAGLMFKRAKRYQQAAEMFEACGVISEAARMFELESNYEAAAERYMKAGMVRSAAVCFERAAQMQNHLMDTFTNPTHENKDIRRLLTHAADAWEKVPDLARAATLREQLHEWKSAGLLYEKIGKTEKALHCYNQAKELDLAINLLKRLNQHKRAAKLLAQKSVKKGDPVSAAQLAEQQQDYARAAEYYERAGKYLEAAMNYERVADFILAAESYFKAGDYKKAAQMYESAGSLETAANLYEDLGMLDQAIRLYVRNQNYTRASRLYLDTNQNEEALRLLLRVPSEQPVSPRQRSLLGICYMRVGKLDSAKKIIGTLLDQPTSRENIEVQYEYAKALQDEGRLDEAMEFFSKIVKFDKAYKDARQLLNWCAAMQEEITAEVSDTIVGELPIGMVINNRYELLQLMGKGGMGIVYRAADRELNLAVALKILKPKYSYDPDFIEMMKREVTLARMLAHPNIIKIYDLNRAGNIWFISMEFLEGEELKTRIIREGPLPLDDILIVFKQVFSALKHSHQNRLVHSDIKPHNIFIDQKKKVTLVDFGIARALGTKSDDKLVHGTPEYISPEQIQGEPPTPRSDLYSTGVTLYEAVTGSLPFEGKDLDETLEKQLNFTPPPVRSIRPETPLWMEQVISKLLEKNPENRFNSAEEVLSAISHPIET